MEKHVYFVRHGESNSNASGLMLGPVAVLTEKGQREAKLVAERIEKVGVAALISSTYKRAIDTAQAISDRIGLPIEQSDLLIEWCRPSIMRGNSWRDPEMEKINDLLLDDQSVADGYRHSDEETFPELRNRIRRALDLLKDHPAERICVVSHGMFLNAFFGEVVFGESFTGGQFKRMFKNHRMHINNTGISEFRYTDEHGWSLRTWNDSAHLG